MNTFLAFFLILFVGLFSSTLLRRLHLPWVVTLILGGLLIGPQALNIFQPDEITEFIGQLGLTFLMFMAGIETELSHFKGSKRSLFLLALFNGLIPALIGAGLGYYLGYPPTTILMISTVFVSSSISIVMPTLESTGLIKMNIGKAVVITSILQDIASLIMLSFLLQQVSPATDLPLIVFYPILVLAIIILRFLLPQLRDLFKVFGGRNEKLYQAQLMLVMLILIGTVIIFELLGLHSIIGAFFAGLVLSDSLSSEKLLSKIRAISYGIFVPTFFILVGAETNIGVLFEVDHAIKVMGLVVLASIFSKFFSGMFGAKLVGYSSPQAIFFGATSIPQLSTTLAVSFIATKFGIITKELNTAFVALSIISTIVGPVIMSNIDAKLLTTGIKEKLAMNFKRKGI